MKTFQHRLKTSRLAKGLTLEELGALVGVTGQAVQRWEKEDKGLGNLPRSSRLEAIAKALGVDAIWLQHGDLNISSPHVKNPPTQINNNYGNQNTQMQMLTIGGNQTKEKAYELNNNQNITDFVKLLPLLDSKQAIEYALDNSSLSNDIYGQCSKVATFIAHTNSAFCIRATDNDMRSSDPDDFSINRNDILIIEPKIQPDNNDIVFVCLDKHERHKRGMVAKLKIDLAGNYFLKKNSSDIVEALPDNAVICGVVIEIKRRILMAGSRIDEDWDIHNSTPVKNQKVLD